MTFYRLPEAKPHGIFFLVKVMFLILIGIFAKKLNLHL